MLGDADVVAKRGHARLEADREEDRRFKRSQPSSSD
jgi:hypothetical protein